MRRFLPVARLFLFVAISPISSQPAFASYTCDRACELCEIGKTVDCASYDYARCMEPVNTLPGGVDQPDSAFFKGWADCQKKGSFCGASDKDSVCDMCNDWCKSEAPPPQAPSAESLDYEAEKRNGCVSGAAHGDTWDDGIKMCRCGGDRTLNAEHTLCVQREADTGPECSVSEDCEKQAAPIYECRGKDLYMISSYQCIQSKCVEVQAGSSTWLKTCESNCVDGYCYYKVNDFDFSNIPVGRPCNHAQDCPVVVDGRNCADKHTAIYAFRPPSCVDNKCFYNHNNETVQVVPCLGDERCTEFSGKAHCVISDVK